ncbi:MAG: 50S ribosome-binding GTPase [Phycisphaerales bacterium]|nr:50S ribosome-binding GTPase [Phycisphaerales bacterium]
MNSAQARRPAPAPAWWRLVSPPPGPSGAAIAIIELTGDVDHALGVLTASPPLRGQVVLRSLAGIDSAVVARVSARTALLMPHAGSLVVSKLVAALTAAGIQPRPNREPSDWPEATTEIERRSLEALATASSPLAIDLLLDQPRRWSAGPIDRADPKVRARSIALRHVLRPPTIVLVGAPNIGKSSLLNALARRSVALVADLPGTTRDHVGVAINFAGLAAMCIDTPGVEPSSPADPIQAEAQRLALNLARGADLVLWCADHASSYLDSLFTPAMSIRVGLRSDLGESSEPADVSVSAHSGNRLPRLVELVREALVPGRHLADPGPWLFWDEPSDTHTP